MRIIDLSTAIQADLESDAPHQAPKIEYRTHKDNLSNMAKQFGLTPEEMPDGIGWATEVITMTTHTGCHMDAPWHYYPTMNHGEPSRTIDQIPLEYCFQDGVHLNFSDRDPSVPLTSEDIKAELRRIGYALKPLDIVLMESGAAPYFHTTEYRSKGAGFNCEATVWLMEQGVKVVGTDSFTWDIPFKLAGENFRKAPVKEHLWEGHRAGRLGEYYQMEKLTNLDRLPGYGFKVICFPVNLKGASAAWTRAVAVLDD